MKQLLAAALLAVSAVSGVQSASAATFPIEISAGSNFFGNSELADGTALTDMFTFTLDADALANSTVISISLNGLQNIDFTSISIDGHAFSKVLNDPMPETWYLDPVVLTAGAKTLTLTYDVSGAAPGSLASYSGTLNISPVPEPTTWAMLLVGFGVVGASMRRNRTRRAVQCI
ncbi:FxDxF family PEP-CTERM protein [Sphingomonas sp. KC8]|uniref:FxDxF family PEP-CTERM protein n=1 Tax=Sphingomonas sp. KC8 TaxID=1030157 RepID=UPI0002EC7D01|nr:FxDxF family PEP-CTERM protein [Sphingomonas sp. KC8]ARS25811.1 PEP-CTERM domain protein [Sphingomonas sp. KC8]